MHQLFQTVRAITKGVNATFEPYHLYSSEWSIITTLKQAQSITQRDLANYLNIEPPAVSRTLSALEKRGLINRTSGMDKREKIISLSSQALAQYPTWLEVSRQHRQTVLANLSSKQQDELLQSLTVIFHSAQPFAEKIKEEDDIFD